MKKYIHICIIGLLMLLIYGFVLPYLVSQPSDVYLWGGIIIGLVSIPVFYNMIFKIFE